MVFGVGLGILVGRTGVREGDREVSVPGIEDTLEKFVMRMGALRGVVWHRATLDAYFIVGID